ncbi:46 kDa FK506-binding nuclear protein, putative [Pediculus humanus corporis]|uniref:46 kDa FK506-binding nuclear protein, putative n=1 Tax=Pediculus humanus subsp. corporis TaxID=121224 RepID=E0VJV5_PEDHC|nr:46 kDa FK506-binding nuclear protein, putative [Pediculus humanus corporis]EEB13661.1 46 kDa FK506-binding nuclear protein, putative [Pediculus humanus corporis]
MADVPKDKLRKEITAILKNADLTKMSAKKVRQQLEEKLEVDLTDQKKVVDDLVMEFLKETTSGNKKSKKTESENEDEDDGEEENGGDDDDDEDYDDEEAEKDKHKDRKKRPHKNNKGSDSEEASDDDDEEEYGPKKKAKTTQKKGAGKKKKKGSDNDSDEDWGKNKKKGGGGAKRGGAKSGYTKPCNLSPELAKLVGRDSMPRHEVVKKIWEIIKERDLYDPENKQYAICDNDLFKVIGIKRFRAFSMMKYLKNHFKS